MSDVHNPNPCPVCKNSNDFVFIRDFTKEETKYYLYQCQECQVQFWLPQTVATHRWYEREGNPYQVRNLFHLKVTRGYHTFFFKRYTNFTSHKKILDLGCGTGEFLAELKKRGCQVFGLDFDREAIKIAKRSFNLQNMYVMSFEEFFKKKNLPKFDMITFFEVLEHVNNPLEFIGEVAKLLAPHGKIILSTPSRERMLVNLNTWDFPPHHVTRWNGKAISKLFLRCGFSISYVRYVEEFKILSESVSSKLKTGLVGKSLQSAVTTKKSLLVPKILYGLGRLKDILLGTIPAGFLWIIGKLIGRNNGIMYIELQKKV